MPQKDIGHIRLVPYIKTKPYLHDSTKQQWGTSRVTMAEPMQILFNFMYRDMVENQSIFANLIPRKEYTWKEKLLWSYYKKPVGVIKRKCKLIWLVLFDDERIEIDREDW